MIDVNHHLGLRDAIGDAGRGSQFAQVVVGIAGGDGVAARGGHQRGGGEQQSVLLDVGVLVADGTGRRRGVENGAGTASNRVVAEHIAIGVVAVAAGSGVAVLAVQVQHPIGGGAERG